MSPRDPGGGRGLRAAATASLALLVLVQTPQAIIQAGGGARLDGQYGASLAVGGAVLLAVGFGYGVLARVVPHTSDHQLVARHISEPSSTIVAAAKLVSYVLVVALAAGFAISSLPLVDLDATSRMLLRAAAVLVLAVPSLLGWQPAARTMIACLAPAAASIAVIIVGGLIIELAGQLTMAAETPGPVHPAGVVWPLGEAVLGACLPAALLGLATERSFGETSGRRVGIRSLLLLMIPVIAGIGALLYLSHVVALPPDTPSHPVLALAERFFPQPLVTAIGLTFVLAALAAALAAYAQVVQLLRLLAADGLLPRHIAAADAHRPRRLVIAIIALTCAAAMVVITSPLGSSTMIAAVMFSSFLLAMAALVSRARRIQRQSTVPGERRQARQSKRAGAVLGALAFAILLISALVQPLYTLVGAVSLAIPSGALLILRRGMGRLGASLAADDLSAGRTLPTRVHAIILVERLDRPTLQAISYVRATRPSTIACLVVDVDPEATEALLADWAEAELPVELRILGTPRGAARRPVIEHVRALRQSSPRDIVIIYAPRVVSPSAIWQRFFVSHSTPALLSELKLEPGVIVAEVPYQIEEVEE